MSTESHLTMPHKLTSWIFATLFIAIGILNMVYVHWVPGVFYLGVAVLYLPVTNAFLFRNTGHAIPIWIKVLAGLVILWATLGVGDLMEVFEAWLRERR
ncbi:hypothetical protein [Muriicola marianensis]|uniref:Uncharacterized protein n=1 Tax=Muriicola marianensis TaxID=1324801 RepID=A0ABQ1QRK9_9FLAO|nr:hypothetical protein [Muriicola marianensis]GGD40214.1 hypothetical protein GCM10011361_04150 [Muriicola marianensis]